MTHSSPSWRRLLAGVLLVSACGGGAAADPATLPAVTVQPENVAVAGERELITGPLLSGTLAAVRQATLQTEVAGTVTEVLVDPGQPVRAGQALVRLDTAAIAEAARSASSLLRSTEQAAVVARRNAERSERLARAGAISERDLEQATWNALNAEASVADAEARLAQARKQLENTVIRAPFGGIVSERAVRTGDIVQAGTEAVSVVDLSSLELEASVPVDALGQLHVGTPVLFRITGSGGAILEGRVTRINPVVDQATGQVRVTVAMPNQERGLVAGLFAEGRAATERRATLAIPRTAVDVRGAAPVVRRLRGGIVEIVAVVPGIRDEFADLVEVREGLAAGDTVLTAGAAGIPAGTVVVISREAARE